MGTARDCAKDWTRLHGLAHRQPPQPWISLSSLPNTQKVFGYGRQDDHDLYPHAQRSALPGGIG